MRGSRVLAIGAVALAFAACQLAVGIHDRHFVLEEASVPETGSDVVTVPPDTGAPCSTDFDNDTNNCGYCGRVCTPCKNGLCPVETIATKLRSVRDIAVDDKHIYVTENDGLSIFDKTGTLVRTAHPTPEAGAYPEGVTSFGGDAYWASDLPGLKILVTHQDGGTTTLYDDLTLSSVIGRIVIAPPWAYWTTWYAGIRRIRLDGSGFEELVADDMMAMTTQNWVVADDSYAYLSDTHTGIARFPHDGGGRQLLLAISPEAIHVNAKWLYYGSLEQFTHAIKRYDLDGGGLEGLTSTDGTTRGIASAGGRVFAVVAGKTPDQCYVLSRSETVDDPVRIALNQNLAAGIGVDDKYVYWLTGWFSLNDDGEIHRTLR